jgi:phosphoadenosine phosphosulfate reductase
MQTKLDLIETDKYLKTLSAIETIQWANREFGKDLYLPTSVGVESAAMFKLVELAGVKTDSFAIESGYWFPETYQHLNTLRDLFGVSIPLFGPDAEDAAVARKLVEEDHLDIDENYKAYNQAAKLNPMSRVIKELGAAALLSGIRSYQTENRKELGKIRTGRDGEYRIHPIIDWTEDQVNDFIREHNLPRHPLYGEGYGSVGDMPVTKPGLGREGRDNKECGLHL